MKVPFNPTDYEDGLTCPDCGGQYLHHGCVEVFDRSEDELKTLVTTVDTGHTEVELVPTVTTNNPSARRHGIRISMACESCGPLDEDLVIYQHKGYTFIAWG